jgi:hypothetical protein
MNFKEWLVKEGTNPGAKTGLYPLGYGGIGLYPPQWYPTRSADAIFYMSIDDRIYKGKDNGSFDITHLPGHGNSSLNKGDEGLWNIKHLKGGPSHKIHSDYAANNGEDGIWNIKKLKGSPTYKKNKDFIPDAGDEGGIWDISHIK